MAGKGRSTDTWTDEAPVRTGEPPSPIATYDEQTASTSSAPVTGAAAEPTVEGERYREHQIIGRGASGIVRRVLDARLGREVAHKSLKKSDPVTLGRFLREARITAQLEHPGIVPIHDIGTDAIGEHYYTMKYVRGHTLADRLDACHGLDDRLGLLSHFVDVCQAIAYAHHRGVVHRDLKPANVMVGEFGETQILDWGLAKVRGEAHSRDEEIARMAIDTGPTDSGATMIGTVLGTPAYMSPEQAHGRIDAIDARSDVWSLGAILYELLTGARPFRGTDPWAVIAQVRAGHAPPVRSIERNAPPELAAIAAKAMAIAPSDRYATAGDLADDITAWMTGGRVSAYKYRWTDEIARWIGRYRAPLAVAAVALAAMTVGGALAVRSVIAEKDRALAAEDQAEQRLAILYASRAVELLDQARWPEAALYAASALQIGPNADARGVLVAVTDAPWPRAVRNFATVCLDAAFIDREHVACANGAALLELSTDTGAIRTLTTNGAVVTGIGRDGTLVALPNGDRPWVRRPGTAGETLTSDPIPSSNALVAGAPGQWLIVQGPTTDIGSLSGPRCLVSTVTSQTGAAYSPARNQWLIGRASFGATLVDPDCTTHDVPNSDLRQPRVVAWSPNGDTVFGDNDGGLYVVDPDSGAVERTIAAHRGAVQSVIVADGRFAVSTGDDGLLAVHDLSDGSLVFRLAASPATRIAAGPGGRFVTWDPSAATTRIWDVGGLLRTRSVLATEAGLSSAAFAAGGRVITFHGDGTVRAWAPDGTELWTNHLGTAVIKGGGVSPDGKRIVAASSQFDLDVLDAVTGQTLLHIPGTGFIAAAWTVDGRAVVASARYRSDGTAAVMWFDATTGAERALYATAPRAFKDLSISPVGSRVAFVDDAGLAYVEDIGTGEVLARCQADAREIVFAADGDTLFTSAEDGTVGRWNWRTGAFTAKFLGAEQPHQAPIDGLAVSSDGALVATASWDRTVGVWDAHTGHLDAILRGNAHRVADASFSPGGAELVTAGWDRSARRWDLRGLDDDPRQIVDDVRRTAGIELVDGTIRMATAP